MVVHLLQNEVEKKVVFFEKMFVFTKYTLFAEKNVFIWKKKIIEKNINENVKKYISFQKYIFTQKMFVLQIKYKSFLNIYSFCKKNFLSIKKIYVKTSL